MLRHFDYYMFYDVMLLKYGWLLYVLWHYASIARSKFEYDVFCDVLLLLHIWLSLVLWRHASIHLIIAFTDAIPLLNGCVPSFYDVILLKRAWLSCPLSRHNSLTHLIIMSSVRSCLYNTVEYQALWRHSSFTRSIMLSATSCFCSRIDYYVFCEVILLQHGRL